MVQSQSLAQELPHAMGQGDKENKKKSENARRKHGQNLLYFYDLGSEDDLYKHKIQCM